MCPVPDHTPTEGSINVLSMKAWSDRAARGLLVIVNPAASTAHDVSESLAARAWRDVHAADDVEAPPVDFEVVYEQSLAEGARAVQRAIQSFR